MNNVFTGGDIKKLAKQKGMKHVVVRFNGMFQTLEISNDVIVTSMEINTGIDHDKVSFVDLYCLTSPSNFQFFVESLKPSDSVTFSYRKNGCYGFRNKGCDVVEVLARVVRGNRVFEVVLFNEYKVG